MTEHDKNLYLQLPAHARQNERLLSKYARRRKKQKKPQSYNNDHAKMIKTDLRRGQVVKIYNRLFTKVSLVNIHRK